MLLMEVVGKYQHHDSGKKVHCKGEERAYFVAIEGAIWQVAFRADIFGRAFLASRKIQEKSGEAQAKGKEKRQLTHIRQRDRGLAIVSSRLSCVFIGGLSIQRDLWDDRRSAPTEN
jgi:hypothetical protein